MMPPPTIEQMDWNEHMMQPIEHVPTRSRSPMSDDGRSQQPNAQSITGTGSASVGSGDDRRDSQSTQGRRSRPSLTASQLHLPSSRQRPSLSDKREKSVNGDKDIDKGTERHFSNEATTIMWETIQEKPSLTSHQSAPEKVVSSRDVLKSFSKVVSRNAEKEKARQDQLDRYEEENKEQRDVHRRLALWADTQYDTWTEHLLGLLIPKYRQKPLPDDEELKALARHYYLPRAEVKCHICDFGPGRAEHHVVDLGRIEAYMAEKPSWVDVRWIHAPLGLGLMHSSVEDIFLHEGEQGREFVNGGRSGWSYLESEVFNLVNRDYFQEMRDVFTLLSTRKELDEDLNASTWKADQNTSLKADVEWRADHLATKATYWNMVGSDMPWRLSEGLAMGSLGPKDGLAPVHRHIDKQTLALFPFYEDAHLVRDPFRTFHRGDGFLLTLSPMAGINYLDKNFSKYLKEPTESRFDNDDASAVGHCFQAFANSGTDSWHRKNVEYFLTYLLTEVLTTPHSLRQGFNAPTIDAAYSSVIQELKRRRFDPWTPKATVHLVRKYLSCIDELTYITLSLKRKLEMFEVMKLDIEKFEGEDLRMGKLPDNQEGESAIQRIDWAVQHLRHDHEIYNRLLIDLKSSLDALFQLRSIEQNEMAIVSDSQNKAILVFTVVTTIFLPLSFFTSYFGMNLQGVTDTKENQAYFWKVCGSVAFILVLIVTTAAFSHHIKRASRQKLLKIR